MKSPLSPLVPRLFALLVLLLVLPGCHSSEAPREARLLAQDLGRDFGLVIGDTIRHRYLIRVPASYTLTPSSLPAEGMLDYWLLLRRVDVTPRDQGPFRLYRIELEYQTFYAPLDVRRLSIPAQQLAFTHGDDRLELALAPWTFTSSPLKEIVPAGVGLDTHTASFMKPALPPTTVDLGPAKHRLLILLILLTMAVLSLLLLSGMFPRLSASPFARARREIRRMRRRGIHGAEDFRACLLAVHRAFDQRAGRTVFDHQLAEFMALHPQFAQLQQEIVQFFRLSRDTFYLGQRPQYPVINELLSLCRQLAAADKPGARS